MQAEAAVLPPACPVCDAVASRHHRRVVAAEQHRRYLDPAAASPGQATAGQLDAALKAELAEVDLYECRDCGLIHCDPMRSPGLEWYGVLYSQANLYPGERWEFRQVLDRCQAGERLLDFGCGDGAFVRAASAAGLRASGVDFSPSSAQRAQASGLDVRVVPADFLHGEPWDIATDGVDHLTAFHVIEHLEAPRDLITLASRVCRAGARLHVTVPSCRRPTRIHGVRDYMDEPPHHLTQWSVEALTRVVKGSPWRLEGLTFEPLAPRARLWWAARHSRSYRAIGRLLRSRAADRAADRAGRLLALPESIFSCLLGKDRQVSGFSMHATYVRA